MVLASRNDSVFDLLVLKDGSLQNKDAIKS